MYLNSINIRSGISNPYNITLNRKGNQSLYNGGEPSFYLPQKQTYSSIANLVDQLDSSTYEPSFYNGEFGPRHFYQPINNIQNSFIDINNNYFLNQSIKDDNAWLTSRDDIMLYGDPSLGRIVAMRPSTMQQVGNIQLLGNNIYSADHITDNKSYVMARGSDFIQVLTRNPSGAFVHSGTISLPFHPRTGAKNQALGLELITGTDKPMFALIDYNTDQLVHAGGLYQNAELASGDFGSSKSTGHGIWLNDNQFVFPDRANHLLQLYHVANNNGQWEVMYQDSIESNTSIHTIIPSNKNNIYYVAMEGRPIDNVTGGLGELLLDNNHISINRVANLPKDHIEKQGTHHPELHPDGIHVYVPSAEGKVHVVDTRTMEVIKSINAGKGAGHVTFIPERNLALVVNHDDTFVTAINTVDHSVIKHIVAAKNLPMEDKALQAHTARVSADGQYYYNFATESGTFFRINLDTLTVDAEYYTGGAPTQASQPSELTYNT